MNIASLVDIHACSAPRSRAIVTDETELTYGELRDQTNQFANLLDEFGIEEGDHLALYLPNVPAFLVSYIGALKRGVVPFAINKRLTGDELEYILEDGYPVAIVTEDDMVDRLPPLGDTSIEHLFVTRNASRGQDLVRALNDQSTTFEPVSRQNSDTANVMYTSGSTGHPKGVVQQHGYHLALGGGRAAFFDLGRNDIGLALSPLFHISGLGIVDIALFLGGPVVLCREWDRDSVLATIDQRDVTYAHLITTLLIEFVEADRSALARHDTSSLQVVMTGGGTVTKNQIQTFEERLGGRVSEGYGRTEGGTSFNPLSNRKLGSNGVPLNDLNEMKIVDMETGDEVSAGEEGEILVRGDAVSVGYFERPDLNEEMFLEGGWMRTKDLGKFDEDGYLYFTGRMDRMIKTGGENVSPTEVENVILDLHGIEEVAVFGVLDEKWGETVAAAVVADNTSLDEDEVEAHCRKHLAGFKIPRTIAFVDAIPKQGTQKVDFAAIEEQVLGEADVK